MSASALTLSFVIVAVGFAAALVPLLFEWTHRTAHRWISFGAGTILGAAFIHMIPEGYELAGRAGFGWVGGGFLALYAIEQLTFHHHPHDEEAGDFHEVGFLAFLGLAFHDLIDGVALGSGHHVPTVEPAIFLALALHKVPTAFAVSLLMFHGGYSKRKVLWFMAIVLLAIPAGVVLAELTIRGAAAGAERLIGGLINFSAGTFIYIGAYELLPEMHRKSEKGSGIGFFFLAGIAAMFVLKFVHPVF